VTTKRRGTGAQGGEEVFYERGEVGKDHITDAEIKEFLEKVRIVAVADSWHQVCAARIGGALSKFPT
jgi:hypothetical protein